MDSLQKHLRMIEELEARLRSLGGDSAANVNMLPLGSSPSSQIIESLQQDKDRQAKEILLLRRTIDEMELRIDTQKQTLNAREESIKKLLEMMQNKGKGHCFLSECAVCVICMQPGAVVQLITDMHG